MAVNPELSRSPYSTREKLARLLWAVVQASLFRLSFHSWYGWRRSLLSAFGARLDRVVRIRRTVRTEAGISASMTDWALAWISDAGEAPRSAEARGGSPSPKPARTKPSATASPIRLILNLGYIPPPVLVR